MLPSDDVLLQGLSLCTTSGILSFQGVPIDAQVVLQLIDADLEVSVEPGSSFTLQTVHRMLKAYPLLQHINAHSHVFMEQAKRVKPKLGVIGQAISGEELSHATPTTLIIQKITSIGRSELTYVEQVLMGEPIETVTGMGIASYRVVFEDKPSLEVASEVTLCALLPDGKEVAIDDYYLEEIFFKPVHINPGMVVDSFYPATAERLAIDYDSVSTTQSTLRHSDLTLADIIHTCLSLNFCNAQERELIAQEQEESAKFFERMDRLIAQHVTAFQKDQE